MLYQDNQLFIFLQTCQKSKEQEKKEFILSIDSHAWLEERNEEKRSSKGIQHIYLLRGQKNNFVWTFLIKTPFVHRHPIIFYCKRNLLVNSIRCFSFFLFCIFRLDQEIYTINPHQ